MTSPIKARRTKQDIETIKAAIQAVCAEDYPVTVRQVFYRLVSIGAIAKAESEYKTTVCRLLADMRREEIIPYHWVADNTRWMRKPRTWSSLERMLKETARTYRRDLWDNQDAYVEIWLEKDALAGVLYEVTEEWDVPLMVTRGYPSLTFLHSAAEAVRTCNKPVYLYYFGDHDPSGKDIPRNVYKGIQTFAPKADIHFQVVAVTPEQIVSLNLPTRPTKKSDSRSKTFKGESVEVDAIPSKHLRELVKNCILPHVDDKKLADLEYIENEERRSLDFFARNFGEAG